MILLRLHREHLSSLNKRHQERRGSQCVHRDADMQGHEGQPETQNRDKESKRKPLTSEFWGSSKQS